MGYRSKKAFTLIELILTVAIMAVVTVALLGMFSLGFRTVAWGGQKSRADFNIQNAADNIFANPNESVPFVTTSIETSSTLQININTGPTETSLVINQGNFFTITASDANRTENMEIFIPD